ncbi:uncharacterized protein LOC117233587 [Bombus vosnesenskii]|uniref:Uncharacterized protein LOC117233587 n=1 Tax=Bombus vosnesenskii TaxID=207650 RepID=A0A6J3KD15_9HYME|nr:uncharacterized protein LOC117233587 [Bombus vosnesenskii]
MKIYEEIDNVYQNGDKAPALRERKTRKKEKQRTIYTCNCCKYESSRYYNMQRHKERIHSREKLNICCGKSFFTKGDYYVHCEQFHPSKRPYAVISRTKYKIINELLPIDYRKDSAPRHKKQVDNSCDRQLRSSRICVKDRMQTKVSLEYSVSCNEFDIENIPLISFLTDHRLKSLLKQLSSSAKQPGKVNEKANEKPKEQDKKQTVKIAISSQQNIEKTECTNGVDNVRTKVSGSSVSSFSLELPTKKLILHRFRSSVHEFDTPLWDQNDNTDHNKTNLAKEIVPGKIKRQRRTKKCKHVTDDMNKENISKFAFSMEQKLNIKLDSRIAVPMTTQTHRNFLEAIDFDKFKIFGNL